MMKKQILVVDIGGTHVKLLRSARDISRFDSGGKMRPRQFIQMLKEQTRGWNYDAVSIGFPAPVRRGRILKDPKHLGKGWIGFNFSKALARPVRVINDASMQALGSYRGGRMLFLGLGTGLGSAFVWERNLLPLELGDLPYRDHDIIENFLGIPGIERLGEKEWKREVLFAVRHLKLAFIADCVVLGGGLIHRIGRLPAWIEPGKNENAYRGGIRLWEIDHGRPKWRVL
jgi:predicted NBD/HSP70 family sugar kinase